MTLPGTTTYANGTTPTTPDAGFTTVFTNASKQLAYVDEGGKVTTPNGQNPVQQTSPGDPTGTTSATAVMMGLAGSLTPLLTGRILVLLSGTIANATAIADGGTVQIRFGTGAAPANGDAVTGTLIAAQDYVAATTAQKSPFGLHGVISGLTLGTAYWIDAALLAITSGTATIKKASLTLLEL